uniref:Transmembrane protein 223 n=1 Tax=Cacopsylla melanoneura TaxID=428564 RepID=A0A8D8LYH7_9HEMI
MSMLNIVRQTLDPRKILICQKCFQLNSKSFSQFNHKWNLNAIVKAVNSSSIKVESKFPLFKNTVRLIATKTKPDTNVVKEVVLYNYVNSKRTTIMLLFGLSQSFFWYYMGYILVTELKDIPVEGESNEDKGFFERNNFGENRWKYSMGLVCAVLGTVAAAFSIFYNTRLVTSIKLDKAGKTITLLISEDRIWGKQLKVPLQNISALYSRNEMTSFFPMKIKDKRFIYIMDMDGKVNNEVLFDVTVGTKRKLDPSED